MQKIAGEKGGECLSKDYTNIETKLLWKCEKGHLWEASPNNVKNNNSWCPDCSGKRKYSIEEIKKLALSKGGLCLSEKYKNINSKLKWKCNKGHIWDAVPSNIISNNAWCPDCAGTKKKSIGDMKRLAELKGGQCLSKIYINTKKKLLWQCADGHKFEANANNVSNGWWCPYCNWYTNEEKCRFVLETLLKTKFIKTRTLIKGYELDGYSAEYNLAFEYNGEQHYGLRFFKFTETKFQKIQIQDQNKKNECLKRGINLMIIPYNQLSNLTTFLSFVKSEFDKFNIITKVDIDSISFINFSQSISTIKELNKIAEQRGGICLSKEYFNNKTKLLWQCDNGHKWEATPDDIKNNNSWCPLCAGTIKHTLEKMQQIAKTHNGKCLSTTYTNNLTKLIWQCEKEHIWEASPNHINQGHWCPKCARVKKLDIAEMESLAKFKGGKCLSNEYLNSKTKLQWQCNKGHNWWATPHGIKQNNTWCPICADTSLTIQVMKNIALEKGGKCLSNEYKNVHTKLLWECENGHQWWAKPTAIKNHGNWCLQCFKDSRYNQKLHPFKTT
ncbi:MAG: hypothetical protein NTX93_01435 [Bacteroidia bacterium]|nr:hypothetical protein [Bacteroidia bacterium]